MEVVGGVAGVVQLAQCASSIVKATHKVCRRLKHAPEEANAVTERLRHFQSEIDRVEGAANVCHGSLLSWDTWRAFETALYEARECINDLVDLVWATRGVTSLRFRIVWAVKDHRRVEKILTRLMGVDARLSSLVSTITFNGISLIMSRMDGLTVSVHDIKGILTIAPVVIPSSGGAGVSILPIIQARTKLPRQQLVALRSSGKAWAALGLYYRKEVKSRTGGTILAVSIQVTTPVASLTGGYMLSFPSPPVSSACRPLVVQSQRRKPSLLEAWMLSAFYWTGNGSIGLKRTPPLQWAVWQKQLDITRLLVARQASQDHVNDFGWSTTFFCWPRLRHEARPMLDYLQVLEEDAYQDLSLADTEGWTVLHRVAAYGHAEEVQGLIALGAEIAQEALPLRWNAMHHAAFYGNIETFRMLVPRYGQGVVLSMRDMRGWKLLHIAASAGHVDIVKDLLALGADVDALTEPFWSHMPKSLHGKRCSVQLVAAAQGNSTEQLYLEALAGTGRVVPAILSKGCGEPGAVQWRYLSAYPNSAKMIGLTMVATVLIFWIMCAVVAKEKWEWPIREAQSAIALNAYASIYR